MSKLRALEAKQKEVSFLDTPFMNLNSSTSMPFGLETKIISAAIAEWWIVQDSPYQAPPYI